jgi:hypothetical protein
VSKWLAKSTQQEKHDRKCNPNTKEKFSMWEVIATNKNGKVRSKVVNHWKHGMRLAGKAMDMGWRVTIVPVYVDFYIADEQGSLRRVVCRLTPKIAACYAIRWAKMDRECGSFVWPHGVPVPDSFKVATSMAASRDS